MSRRTSDTEMEADIDLEPDRSRFGAFLRGTALALLVCAAAVVVVSLVAPLPEDLPRPGRVEIVGAVPAPAAPDEAAVDTAAPETASVNAAAPDEAAPGTEAPGTGAADATESGAAGPLPPEAPAPNAAVPETAGSGSASPADAASETPATSASGESVGARPQAPAPDEPQAVPEPPFPDATGSAGTAAGAPPPAAGGALTENARPFDAPDDAPLMAVVLVGDAVEALTPERLSLLTMPLNVAIPAGAADPLGLAAAARESGHEVMIDVELTGDAAEPTTPALDLAVAATATGAGAAGAEALGPVLDALAPRGLAWIDTGIGFGTSAERLARERGMTYTQGNRAVAGDVSPEQIYRAIDSASQQARQWGTAVLLLEATEPALQALIRWGLEQSGDSAVWFAPISAVIARRGAR